ncbi:MAG: threonine synthase [Candidatus Sumerlaeia bacterium]|nr:threonine synthase [Candidatus Sumerlaeia bacterium]
MTAHTAPATVQPYAGLIHRYREHLPVSDKTPVISLCEGNTPLVPLPALSRELGPGVEAYAKYEGLNPTGSFKDRGMTMAVSKAVEEGSRAVICASTGNTSASAAAYAARAGIRCAVLIPSGKNVALGKLAQAAMHGATVVRIEGNFDEALDLVRDISRSHPITLVNSVNPYRIEGQKTGAFEICDQLGGVAPHLHCIPVGNAGNITAYWRGYRQWAEAGRIDSLPRMWGFQAAGAAPIVQRRRVEHPETIATAIRIGNPASWCCARCARDESRGLIDSVTDTEITAAYQFLAAKEGVFCEPSSAASVAGLLKMKAQGVFDRARAEIAADTLRIVCVLTGHGLKDPDYAVETASKPVVVPAEMGAVLGVLGMA